MSQWQHDPTPLADDPSLYPRPPVARDTAPNVNLEGMTDGREAPTSGSTRLPRYRRADSAPRIVLTPRDIQALQHVCAFELLTREQLAVLLNFRNPDSSQLKRRLTLLYHHGYLARLYVPVLAAHGAARAVYSLDRLGAEVLAREASTTPSALDWRLRDLQRQVYFLQHTVDTNEAVIRFLVAATAEGLKPEWRSEKSMRRASFSSAKMPLIPDAYVQLQVGERLRGLALELDRGTVGEKAFKSKVQGYGEWNRSGAYKAVFGQVSLRVLFILGSQVADARRLTRMKTWCEAAGGGSLFWFGELSSLKNPSMLRQPIWVVAGRESQFPLLGGAS